MHFLPKPHSATIPALKSSDPAYRILPFFVSSMHERQISTTHWHDYTQLWYTVSGTYNHIINGENIKQSAGSLILVPPFAVHSVDTSGSNPQELCLIKVSIYEDLFLKGIMPYRPLSYQLAVYDQYSLSQKLIFFGKDKKQADMLFEEMLSEFSKHHDMNQSIIFNNIEKIFQMIAKNTNEVLSTTQIARAHEQFGSISAAANIIDRNYTQNISLAAISKHVFMSQTSFSNKFGQTTGQTFFSYYNKSKTAHAIWLLSHSSIPFYAIAEECGFCDPTHLTHTIKKSLGVSPLFLRSKFLEHNKTFGLQEHLRQMDQFSWMNILSDEEITYFRNCAVGLPAK